MRKEWNFTLPAIILMCLMVFGSFVGSLNSAYMPSTANESMLVFEENITTPALDEMPGRMAAQLAYDSESDRVIMFGGAIENLESNYQDTWSFDYNTNTWTNMSPATNPLSVEWHQMTYHSGQDRVVLFGGHLSGGASNWLNSNETWTYDYNTNTWTDMDPVVAPPGTCGSSMVYDSESDLIVLYGGWHDGGPYGSFGMDTWTYDLVSNTWTNVSTTIQPSSRSWAQMAYDSESDDIVLFGGWENEPELYKTLNDTWTFDANTNTWTEIVTDGPNILGDMEYDSESDRVVFWGGFVDMDENQYVSETWTFDDNSGTWEQMSPNPTPPGRTRGEVTYDSESDRIILFGGSLDSGFDPEDIMNDCWAYDLNNNLWNNVEWDWQEITPTESPLATAKPAMTYDSESDLVVMFGGHTDEGFLETGFRGDNETWTFDYNTNTWTNMSPATAPSMRSLTDMVYDEESDIIILFGGSRFNDADMSFLGDTWTYDVNTNTWTNVTPAESPSGRFLPSMTYDSKSDLVILFGGNNGTHNTDETWTYDYNSNTWTLMSPSVSPSPRHVAALAYDEESEISVLFGGFLYGDEEDDTWVYNSTADTWTEMSPSIHPSKRSETKAVYQPSVDRVIMFGGWAYDVIFDETWSYDYNTNNWTEMNTLNAPSARYWSGVAFDSESNRTILFSGDEGLGNSISMSDADTWEYRYQINPPILIPGPPRNLVVTSEDDGLSLTWVAPVPIDGVTVIGYNVYRGSASGNYEMVFEHGNVLTYTDSSAGYDITYYYVVTAYTDSGEGPYSNEATGIRDLVPYDDSIFSFVAYGDTRASDETSVSSLHDDIVSHYLQHDPELIIHTGDLVNHGGEEYQWPLFDASISAIYDWDTEMDFYAAVGNHEIYTDVYGVDDEDYSTYLDYVDFSDVIDEPGETELYYSFNREGIHFIFLNTVEEWDGDVFTCPTAQMDWLETDLAGNYSFIVVSFHNPAYSIRADRSDRWAQAESIRDTFHTMFVDYEVDLVLTGHDHYYYRAVRDGIQYIVAAGGGAPLYDIDIVHEDSAFQEGDIAFSEYSFCVASLIDGQLVVKVYLLDGTIADSFNLTVFIPDTGETRFPIEMVVIIIAGVGVVLIVIVIVIIKKKK